MKKIISLLAFTGIVLINTVHAAGNIETGRALSTQCTACHGTYGLSSSEQFPNIAGQKESYLVSQLEKYKSGERTDPTMDAIVGPLNPQNILDLAAYYASNSPVASYSFEKTSLSIPYVNVGGVMYNVDMFLTSPDNLVFTVRTLEKR